MDTQETSYSWHLSNIVVKITEFGLREKESSGGVVLYINPQFYYPSPEVVFPEDADENDFIIPQQVYIDVDGFMKETDHFDSEENLRFVSFGFLGRELSSTSEYFEALANLSYSIDTYGPWVFFDYEKEYLNPLKGAVKRKDRDGIFKVFSDFLERMTASVSKKPEFAPICETFRKTAPHSLSDQKRHEIIIYFMMDRIDDFASISFPDIQIAFDIHVDYVLLNHDYNSYTNPSIERITKYDYTLGELFDPESDWYSPKYLEYLQEEDPGIDSSGYSPAGLAAEVILKRLLDFSGICQLKRIFLDEVY